jgi:uncharacterized protein YmfQ (DUF2313 family)
MELQLEWREAESQSWLLVSEDGKRVHGQVYAHDDRWVWIATVPRRVRLSPADGVTYSGLATTASGAKRIVETILEEAGTLSPKSEKKEDTVSSSAAKLLDALDQQSARELLEALGVTLKMTVTGKDIEEALRLLAEKGREPPDKMGYPGR